MYLIIYHEMSYFLVNVKFWIMRFEKFSWWSIKHLRARFRVMWKWNLKKWAKLKFGGDKFCSLCLLSAFQLALIFTFSRCIATSEWHSNFPITHYDMWMYNNIYVPICHIELTQKQSLYLPTSEADKIL